MLVGYARVSTMDQSPAARKGLISSISCYRISPLHTVTKRAGACAPV